MPEPRTSAEDRAPALHDQAGEPAADRTLDAAAPAAEAPAGVSDGGGSALTALRGSLKLMESRAVKLGFVAVMVLLGVWTVVDEWSEFKHGIDQIGVAAGIEALLFVLLGLLLNLQVWRGLLTASGSRLNLRQSSRVYFVGQLGKYMPGSVWPVLAQMELGRAYKVPRERSATVAMLAMTVGLASGLLATLVGVPFMGGGKTHDYWWAFLFIPVLLVCLHPKVLNPLLARALRLLGRKPPEQALSERALLTAMAINVLSWVANGLQIWVMTLRLGTHEGHSLLISIGAYAFAWCVGFLIVFAPAGAGAREVILIATLTPVVGGYGAALAIAVVSRLVTILGDLIGAAAAGGLSARRPGAPASRGSA